jgi:hypothetical protein
MKKILFIALFLITATGAAVAQSGNLIEAAAPYGKHTFHPAPVAVEALQNQLPALYAQLNVLTAGTKMHKQKKLEILCYKGVIDDIIGGKLVDVAYENNLADLTQYINVEDSADLVYLRNVQSALFDLLTN